MLKLQSGPKYFYVIYIDGILKVKYFYCPIRKKAKGRVSVWIYFSQLITTFSRCVVSR